MGIFDRIRGMVGETETPTVRIERTDYVGTEPHSVGDEVVPGDAVAVPIRVAGGEERRTVRAVELELVHVPSADDPTPLLERHVAEEFALSDVEERTFEPTLTIPENTPRSGDLPTRLRATLAVEDGPDDSFTGYLDVGPNPLITAARTEFRVLGFTLAETDIVDRPGSGFWPDAALGGEFLLSLQFVPDDRGERFTLVPVAEDGSMDCYLQAGGGDDWHHVRVEDAEDPADRFAGALDELGVRN